MLPSNVNLFLIACSVASATLPLQIFQLHLSLIAQLEAMPDMAHWAVYVALHLPTHAPCGWAHLRDSLVQELIMSHAPEWAADATKQDFLLQKLQLPATWLDQSLAQWAHYRQDDSGKPAGPTPKTSSKQPGFSFSLFCSAITCVLWAAQE